MKIVKSDRFRSAGKPINASDDMVRVVIDMTLDELRKFNLKAQDPNISRKAKSIKQCKHFTVSHFADFRFYTWIGYDTGHYHHKAIRISNCHIPKALDIADVICTILNTIETGKQS